MGIIQRSVAEHASQSQWALMTGPGIRVTRLRSEDLTVGGGGEISAVLLGLRGGGAAGSADAPLSPVHRLETSTREPRKIV